MIEYKNYVSNINDHRPPLTSVVKKYWNAAENIMWYNIISKITKLTI